MDGFRKAVKSKLISSAKEVPKKETPTKPTINTFKNYLVRIESKMVLIQVGLHLILQIKF